MAKTADEVKKEVKTITKKIEDRYGIETDVFCDKDIEIYVNQMDIADGLLQKLRQDGYTVEKTYSGGKSNTYSHPSIADYNKTADSSHKTVNAIRKFIKEHADVNDNGEDDLMKLLDSDDNE